MGVTGVDDEVRALCPHTPRGVWHMHSGVFNGGRGVVASGAADEGRKSAPQKYLMTNRHKNEYDKVWWMSQKKPITTNICNFGCQLV